MLTNKPQMVLIDVDGTLVDSVPDLAWCIDEMMLTLGLQKQGEDKVRQWVGNGVERLVRRALIGQIEGEPDESLFKKAYPLFLDLYKDNTSKRSLLYDGVIEGLDYLKNQGYILGCVTNKAEAFTLPILKDLGIFDYFQSVVSGDSLAKKKPDPMPLLYSAEKLGVSPLQSMMLGDSMSDVKAARAAGFSIICMSYGYNHGEDISLSEPDEVIDSMTELEAILSKLS
ncbi:MAG: phosphoglycolate phosphatase [Pseudomonadota bacterium]